MEIIDADGHVFEKDEELFEHLDVPGYAGKRTVRAFPFWPMVDGFQRGAIHARLGVHESFETDAGRWLRFLDHAEISSTVLYPTAALGAGLLRDKEWAVVAARAYNNWLSERYLKVSPRLRGVALLPLQDPREAAAELRRAVSQLRMVGALLPVGGLGKSLGHADFDPVYAEAERLDCALAVHGGSALGLGLDVLEHFAQVHTLSHPAAQMIQVTSIVMSGVLDRFPRLRIAFLEAGASWVPFLMDRMDRSYRARRFEQYVGAVRNRPSEYVKSGRLFFGADPSESTLGHVRDTIGDQVLLFSSDFPHEVNADGCREEIAELRRREDLTDEAKRRLFAGNARRLYGFPGAV
jgi:hypothetical protein